MDGSFDMHSRWHDIIANQEAKMKIAGSRKYDLDR